MNLNDEHTKNVGKIIHESMEQRRTKANLRSDFLEEDNAAIVNALKGDLKKHMDDDDTKNCIPVTLDNFVGAFLQKICNVYDTPVVFKFGKGADQKDQERFSALMNEVKINQVMQGNNIKMRLHNCILDHVRYNEDLDRLFIENDYTIGTSMVITYPTYRYEPRLVAYETYTAKNELVWIAWDRITKEHFMCKEAPKVDPDTGLIVAEGKKPIPPNLNTAGPGYWPWVVYRYREHNGDFWGNGMDWLINLCRVINTLLTVTGDDAFQQNLRLLIMNFTPAGNTTADEYPDTEQNKSVRLKVGMKHPIFPKEGSVVGAKDGEKASAQVVQADLFLDNIVTFVQKLSDMAGSLQGVDSVLKREVESTLSGIALAIRNQPILNQWSKDIQILRDYDRELIKTIVDVNNYHRGIRNENGVAQKTDALIDPKILDHLTIDYQRPQLITDEKAEYELEKMKWSDGTSSPVIWVMRRNPEMDEKAARAFVEKNIKDWNDLNGMGVTVPEPDNKVE